MCFPSLASTRAPASRSFSAASSAEAVPRRQDEVVFRKVRVEADPDTEAGEIRIGQRLVHRRLSGSPKSLKVKVSTWSAASGNAFRNSGITPSGSIRRASAGTPGMTATIFPFPPHGKAGRRPRRVGDDLRPLREEGLFGVVFRPAKPAFLE